MMTGKRFLLPVLASLVLGTWVTPTRILSQAYQAQIVAQGLAQPTEIAFLPESNTEMIVLEKTGKAKLINLTTGKQRTVIDISHYTTTKSEQGLLGIAFSHRYRMDKTFFLSYTTVREDADGREDISVVAKYQADIRNLREPIRDLGKALFVQSQPFANHNGGCIRVLKDGYLYLGLGDGGSANDPLLSGQNPESYLGKLIRFKSMDVNPVPEIYAMGLRNPWKFSADSESDEIYLADVGQNRIEEVNLIVKGGNYGWNIWEGNECFQNNPACQTPEGRAMLQPIFTYNHDQGKSITGGFVYRGTKIPQLYGKYVFGDFVTGRIWAIWKKGDKWLSEELLHERKNISSFGQATNGEIYFASFSDGKIFWLRRVGR